MLATNARQSKQRVSNAIVPSVPYIIRADGTAKVWTEKYGLTTADGVKVLPSSKGRAVQVIPPSSK